MVVTLSATIALGLLSPAAPASQLDSFAAKLNTAEALNIDYRLQVVGGGVSDYSLSLARPNKARIMTPEQIIIADGDKVIFYSKKDNSFYKKAQNDQVLRSIFDDLSLSIWLPFFDGEALKSVASAKDAGTKKIRGEDLNVVNVMADKKGDTSMTLYLGKDKLARQAEFVIKTAAKETRTIMIASKVDMTPGAADVFAFNAPNGAKEISEADLVANKWFHNFDEAQKIAQATGKIMMVDFMASWCGPCKMMDKEVFQSAPFKDRAKNFVLVKIDVDEQQALAQRFKVEAMPTVKFINASGSVVHEFVGYGGPAHVFGEMEKASKKA